MMKRLGLWLQLDHEDIAMPDLLTVAEAAAQARVSRRTLERWVRSGVLPAQRFGPRLLRIAADDLAHVGKPVMRGVTK